MPKMRAVQVPRPKAAFEIVERDIPEPGPGSVRVKVQACGICHSDGLVTEGAFPLVEYPRVPGHGVIGGVDASGPGATRWPPGTRPPVLRPRACAASCERC